MTAHMIEEALQSADTTNSQSKLQTMLRGEGGGAWIREASRTLALAAQAHVRLDEETLIYSDVRDLMALQWRLRAQAEQR